MSDLVTSVPTSRASQTRPPRSTPSGEGLDRALPECSRVKIHPTILWGGVSCVGLYLLLWWSTLEHFVFVWSNDDNYTHGFLVPLISLYFAREASLDGPRPYRSALKLGLSLLAFSALVRYATIPLPIGILGDFAFVLGIAGLVAAVGGLNSLRQYGFPLFFLVFMIPLPVALYTMITQPLQLLVSKISSGMLNTIGIPVLCEGNTMTLPGDVKMFVAEACSGMRQLTGFLALTTAVAYLSPRPWWFRAVLIASSIPIAMTANIIRVILTGWIMYYIDPRYASGTFHTIEGLLMMGLGLGLLSAEIWLLNQVIVLDEAPPTDLARGGTAAQA